MATFGFSVSDFLATLGLVRGCIQALSESTGAKTKYQDLMHQLYTLERALIVVKALDPSQAELDAVQQAVGTFQQCITIFLKKVEKYQPLSAGTTSLRDQVKKVKWALCHEEDVKSLKESLAMRTESLLLLINATHFAHSVKSAVQTEQLQRDLSQLLHRLQADMSAKDSVQMDIAEDVKRLLLADQYRVSAPASSSIRPSFEVRPFRLAGAPLAPAFVERPDLMHKIEAALLPIKRTQQVILVLQGLGGNGKSQIAREYATEHQNDYSAIFWINAKSESSLKQSMADVARRIGGASGFEETNEATEAQALSKATAAVLDWLDRADNTDWLLIFDDVDSQAEDSDNIEEPLPGSVTKPFDVSVYFPSTTQGTLLFTSRLSYLARQCGGVAIGVDRMTPKQGLEVLSKICGREMEAMSTLSSMYADHDTNLSLSQKPLTQTAPT